MAFRIVTTTEIAAPAAASWGVLADYSRDAEWRAGVTSMVPTPLGLVRVGTTTVEHLRVAGRSHRADGEVTSVDPGRRFSWRTTSGPVAHGSRTVTPLGAGRCAVELDITIEPRPVERALAPVLRRVIERSLRGDVERLRALVEQEAPRPAAGSAERAPAPAG